MNIKKLWIHKNKFMHDNNGHKMNFPPLDKDGNDFNNFLFILIEWEMVQSMAGFNTSNV